MIIATPSAITVMFTGTWVTTEMTSAVAKSLMPSASVRVITKMIAATFLTSGPKRRSSSSYDVQLAAEIRRQEQHAHQEAADHVAQRQLQERHVRCIGAGRHADEAQRAGLGGDDGEADRPPRHRTAGQEVVAVVFWNLANHEPKAVMASR